MKKNPFKKAGIVSTAIRVGVGGAANVAIDYAVKNVEAVSSLGDTVINVGKIVVGALAGSMSTNKWVHAAADGIATVGASSLVSSLISDGSVLNGQITKGLPYGTICGYARLGNKAFKRSVHGVSATPTAFMTAD